VTSRFSQDKALEARNAQTASQTEAFKNFLERKHPEIRFGIALMKEIQEYMLDSFLTAMDEDFEYALQNMDTRYMRQHVPTPEETKAALIDKIMELLQSTNNRHWSIDHNVKTERSKMQFWSLEQLTARLDEVVRAQTLASKSPVELRQIVESGRKYVGYPQLGKTIVPPGKVRAVPQDAAYLKLLDPWELKKLVRLYGISQVNDRLAGKD
jgi:arsenate reductase-like glutaredoxin family protein